MLTIGSLRSMIPYMVLFLVMIALWAAGVRAINPQTLSGWELPLYDVWMYGGLPLIVFVLLLVARMRQVRSGV